MDGSLWAATLGYCLFAGVVPILSSEVYLALLATRLSAAEVPGVALAAGAGQTAGKLVWYYAAVRTTRVPWLGRRLDRARRRPAYERWRARLVERPEVGVPLVFTSALVGLPPLVVTSVVAGAARMRPEWYAASVLAGRSLQAWAILAGVQVGVGVRDS